MNAYYMLSDLRDNIGEGVGGEAHWDDAELLRKLNSAQKEVGMLFQSSSGDWLLKSVSVTPSSSVITLPTDCSKPVHLEETSGGREIVWGGTVRERWNTRPSAARLSDGYLDFYMQGNTIIVNQESYSTACTLWYDQRIINLHAGTAASGTTASTVEFDADNEPSGVDDYYNGVGIEVMDETSKVVEISSAITDYVGSTKKATMTGSPVAAEVYGTISILPEECHNLIVMKATVNALAKPSSALDEKYFEYFLGEMKRMEKRIIYWVGTRVRSRNYVASSGIL